MIYLIYPSDVCNLTRPVSARLVGPTVLPQAALAIIASDVHADLGLDDGGHMYLIDLDLNPYERTTCPDGGNHPACSNLYHHEAYADVREELEAIMETVSWGGQLELFLSVTRACLGIVFMFCHGHQCDGNEILRATAVISPLLKKHLSTYVTPSASCAGILWIFFSCVTPFYWKQAYVSKIPEANMFVLFLYQKRKYTLFVRSLLC